MLDFILFQGRIGRLAWIFYVLLSSGLLVFAATRLPWVEGRLLATEEEIVEALLWPFVIAVWLLMSATIRRLRDAGSPLPLVEFLIGVLIPFLGPLWLVYRLLLTGSREAPKLASLTSPVQGPDAPWSRGTTPRPASQRTARSERRAAEAAREEKPVQPGQIQSPRAKRLADPETPTVARRSRGLFGGARRIGF